MDTKKIIATGVVVLMVSFAYPTLASEVTGTLSNDPNLIEVSQNQSNNNPLQPSLPDTGGQGNTTTETIIKVAIISLLAIEIFALIGISIMKKKRREAEIKEA